MFHGSIAGGMDERADDRTIGHALDDQTGGEGASRRATGHDKPHACITIGLVHPSDGEGGLGGFHF